VTCDGFVPPPPPPPYSKKIWNSTACSCADYCDFKCSNAVEHYNTERQNVTLYRLTPYNAPGIDSMNTGDPGGDVDFVLSRKEIAVECEQNPGGERCFLAHANIYLRVEVEVDGKWGPYQFCNPEGGNHPNVSRFDCCSSFDHDDAGTCLPPGKARDESSFSPYPNTCDCARGNVSVGQVDHGEMEKWAGWASHNTWSTTLGGVWYSTPRNGKCGKGQRPGTGKKGECTWRTVASSYKNTSCVDAHLDDAIEAHGKTCFDTCPPKTDKGAYYACYIACYFDAVGGNPTSPGGPLKAMSKQQLTDPWVTAIGEEDPLKGGCPLCNGEPPYHLGSCPWHK